MCTLQSVIVNGFSYDSSWGIWAELIDNQFKPESKCRFGQIIFENGGLLDDFKFVGLNTNIEDWVYEYTEGDNDFREEAIDYVIEKANELINHQIRQHYKN